MRADCRALERPIGVAGCPPHSGIPRIDSWQTITALNRFLSKRLPEKLEDSEFEVSGGQRLVVWAQRAQRRTQHLRQRGKRNFLQIVVMRRVIDELESLSKVGKEACLRSEGLSPQDRSLRTLAPTEVIYPDGIFLRSIHQYERRSRSNLRHCIRRAQLP